MSKKEDFFYNLPTELQLNSGFINQYKLSYEVISCAQASRAKNILLRNELKSLVLLVENDSELGCMENLPKAMSILVAHMPGDTKLDLRKIKNLLELRQASLASPEELKKFGMVPGTVCALHKKLWVLPQIVSELIFDLDFVSTNDGTRTGYIMFPPSLFHHSENLVVGDITR